ncbi:MAG: single-stranded DNA-binding protein [Spirochaetes bacterium]|nr:MAG: single-stranded DNA-binding protein [Spirochaetota bacterium]
MAGETQTTIVGNLVADPELRFLPNGTAVANMTVASTPRKFDRASNAWVDEPTLFMRCSVWREAAENVAESLHRGTRVIVQGRLKMRSYETKEGEKRTTTEMDVDEVGPSLRYASAKVTKAERSNGQGGFGGQQQPQGQQQDPWATGGGQQQGGWGQQPPNSQSGPPQQPPQQPWGNAPSYDEPPF